MNRQTRTGMLLSILLSLTLLLSACSTGVASNSGGDAWEEQKISRVPRTQYQRIIKAKHPNHVQSQQLREILQSRLNLNGLWLTCIWGA